MMAMAGMVAAPSGRGRGTRSLVWQRIWSPAMDPLLVISNAEASTADEESLATALGVLREHCSVEVQATSKPGELDSALHRAGSRRIVVAGGGGRRHGGV